MKSSPRSWPARSRTTANYARRTAVGRLWGDPTEVSLIVAARKVKADRKIKRYTRVGEIPFTSERKRMSIIAKDSTDSDKLTVFAKARPTCC